MSMAHKSMGQLFFLIYVGLYSVVKKERSFIRISQQLFEYLSSHIFTLVMGLQNEVLFTLKYNTVY